MESPVPEKAWDFLKAVDSTLTGRLCWLLLLVHIAMHQLLFQRGKKLLIFVHSFPCTDDGKCPEGLCPAVWCHVPFESEKSFSGIWRNISWDSIILGWHIFISLVPIIWGCARNSTERRKICAPLYCRTLFPMVWETYSFQCWLHIMGVNWGTSKSKVTDIYSLVMGVNVLKVKKQNMWKAPREVGKAQLRFTIIESVRPEVGLRICLTKHTSSSLRSSR